MIVLWPHGSFIIAAYAFAVLALIGLFVWILLDLRRQTRLVVRLEAARTMHTDDSASPTP
ncbi:heme exporter protein CcmD [Candidatus Raskinella chloraquaticus]|uniref:heme exporter protein CcmD n=1 Tax=Candidatus Raskinella chloraquaticus TaxID=1951219 RepID=UPI00378645D9